MEKSCPICNKKYDTGGDGWKKVCYDCYKNYRYMQKRIEPLGYKADVYISHPSVTKEDMDEWIRKTGKEHGWGCKEYKPEEHPSVRIWINSTNWD